MAREFSKHLTIRVSNLPDEATENDVKIYFQRKKNGRGEVTEVRMIPNSHEALVMFEEEEVAERVVTQQLIFKGVNVHVEKYKETEEEIPNEESRVLVGDLPEGITQNEIHIHFQRKKNRGGEIKEVKLLSESEALVVFKDPKVASAVVNKEHVIKRKPVRVQIMGSEEQAKEESPTLDSVLFEEGGIAEVDQMKSELKETTKEFSTMSIEKDNLEKTILVSDIPNGITEKEVAFYFQKRDNGGEVETINMFSEHRTALVVFSEVQDAENAIQKEHKLAGQQVRVEKYKPKPKVDCVFTQITAIINPSLLQNIEPTVRKAVLDKTQEVTGIQWHEAAYGLLITGTLEQVNKANDILKSLFSEQLGYEHRASCSGSEINNQDIAKNPSEMRAREGCHSPRQSSIVRFPQNNPRKETGVYSPRQKLIAPAYFQPHGRGSNVGGRGSAISPEQQTQSSGEHQNSASVDTALPEYQTRRTDQTEFPSKADRRPNAAYFEDKTSQNVENDSLQGKETAGILKRTSAAMVVEKDTSGGYLRQSSDGQHQSQSDKSENGNLPNDANDLKEQAAEGYERNQGTSINLIENAFQQMNLDEEPPATHVAQFILQVYKNDLKSFKSQHSVDVVFSQDQKRLTLKSMRGFDISQKNELESKFQHFYKSTSKKLKEVTIDLREFGTTEDIEKMKESMSRQGKQFEVMMIEESSDHDVFTLVGDADNMKMFRKNLIGALRKNSPDSKETLPAEPIVASRKGIQVILMQGDIEKQECDAIVNFTDKDLVHKTGIAKAIHQAAGMTFKNECKDIIDEKGSLLSNSVTITTAGLLPCQHVIHAILPDFTTERSQEVLCHDLQETCRLALDKAKENQMKSISFPVVTPNIVNQVVSPHLLFNAIIEFTKENNPLNNNTTIEEIRIVYRENSKLVEEYANEFSKNF